MPQKRMLIVLVLIGLSLLLSLQQQRITQLQRESVRASEVAFKQQLYPGFACGLLTSKEAQTFLNEQNTVTSGTIIPADSPTAQVRQGSPRLDSCAHSVLTTNTSYIDIVVKTYDTAGIAADAYKHDIAKIMYAEPGSFTNESTTDTYSSGVHYILSGKYAYEISASRVGSSTGSDLRHFSDMVVAHILTKL